jgi:hypothetical protein
VEVTNPHVGHSSLNEDLDATLRSLISLLVLDLGGPSSFGVDAFDARSFRIDVRVIARRVGGWAYKGSAIMVEVPVCIGNKSPEVVDAIDMVIGCFEKDRGDGVGETNKIVIDGLTIDGEEERLGYGKG